MFLFSFGETFRLIFNRYISFWQKDLITWQRQKKLWVVVLICFLLIILNPTGYKMYSYPLKLTTQSTFMSQIYEWQPPFESPTFKHSYAFVYYLIWIGLLGISFMNLTIRGVLSPPSVINVRRPRSASDPLLKRTISIWVVSSG